MPEVVWGDSTQFLATLPGGSTTFRLIEAAVEANIQLLPRWCLRLTVNFEVEVESEDETLYATMISDVAYRTAVMTIYPYIADEFHMIETYIMHEMLHVGVEPLAILASSYLDNKSIPAYIRSPLETTQHVISESVVVDLVDIIQRDRLCQIQK